MRFIIGLLLGLGIGLVAALLLLSPEKGRGREGEPPGDEASPDARFPENHDSLAGLRRAMGRLQEQVQEAWEEARQAAQEAEQDMRARYDRAVTKPQR